MRTSTSSLISDTQRVESLAAQELDRFGLILQVHEPLIIKSEAQVLDRLLYQGRSAFLFKEYSLLGLVLQKIGAIENQICHSIFVVIIAPRWEIRSQIVRHLTENHFFNKEPASLRILLRELGLPALISALGIRRYGSASTLQPDYELRADLISERLAPAQAHVEISQNWREEIAQICILQAKKEYLEGNPVCFEYVRDALELLYPETTPGSEPTPTPQQLASAIADAATSQNAQVIVLEGERGTGKSITAHSVAKAAANGAVPVPIVHVDDFFRSDQEGRFKRSYSTSPQTPYPPDLSVLIDLPRFQMALAKALAHPPVVVEGLFASEIVPLCSAVEPSRLLEVLFDLPHADHISRALARDFLCRHPVVNPDSALEKYDSVLKHPSYRKWIAAKRRSCAFVFDGRSAMINGQEVGLPASGEQFLDPIFTGIAQAVRYKDPILSIHRLDECLELARQFNYQLLNSEIQRLTEFFRTKERALGLYTRGDIGFAAELCRLCEQLGVPEAVIEKYRRYLFHNRDLSEVAAFVERLVVKQRIRVILLEGKKGAGKSTLKTSLRELSERYADVACDSFVNAAVHRSLVQTGMYDAEREPDGYYVKGLYDYPRLIGLANAILAAKPEQTLIIEGERIFPIMGELSVPREAVLRIYLDTSFERNVAQVLFRDTLLRWPFRSAQETMARLKKTCDARTAQFFEHELEAAEVVVGESEIIDRTNGGRRVPLSTYSGLRDPFFVRFQNLAAQDTQTRLCASKDTIRVDAFSMGFQVLQHFLLPLQHKLIIALRRESVQTTLHLYNSYLERWGEPRGVDVSQLQLPPDLPVLDLQVLAGQIDEIINVLAAGCAHPVALYLHGNSGCGKTLLLDILTRQYGHRGVSMEHLAYLNLDHWNEAIATKFMSSGSLSEFVAVLLPCLREEEIARDLRGVHGGNVVLEGLFALPPFQLSETDFRVVTVHINFSTPYSERLRWFRQIFYRGEPFDMPFGLMAAVARLNDLLTELSLSGDAVIDESGAIAYRGELIGCSLPSTCPTIPFVESCRYDSALQVLHSGSSSDIAVLNSERNYSIPTELEDFP